MFLNHDTAFADFIPAATQPRNTATLSAQTMLETRRGWAPLDTLQAGDAVATLDGGFATITALTHPQKHAPLVHIPGGVLSTCSDIALPADAHVALRTPARWIDRPIVSVPVNALSGWRGVRPTLFAGPDLVTVHFADEEVIFAQTGLMVHAAPTAGETFFPRLSYGDARAMLALADGRIGAPDTVAA